MNILPTEVITLFFTITMTPCQNYYNKIINFTPNRPVASATVFTYYFPTAAGCCQHHPPLCARAQTSPNPGRLVNIICRWQYVLISVSQRLSRSNIYSKIIKMFRIDLSRPPRRYWFLKQNENINCRNNGTFFFLAFSPHAQYAFYKKIRVIETYHW